MSRVFGEIRQNGYVVRDVEAAMRHWSEVLGVGPFFYFERVPIEDFRYKGEPSPIEVSIALANSGALQIELIQQRNDTAASSSAAAAVVASSRLISNHTVDASTAPASIAPPIPRSGSGAS